MAPTETWTIGRLLTWTTDFLRQRGCESPRLDAEVLLAHARGCARIQLYASFDEEPTEQQRGAFRELVKRRADGTPVAYLVGHKEFYSLDFRVTPDVLIPRPETEHLVIALLDLIKKRVADQGPARVADVGTGSGAIAISAAKTADIRVTAIDISPKALAIAAENVAKHNVAARVELVESDLFAGVAGDSKFDFVVSNPPYISEAEMKALPRELREHEPALALSAGADGMAVIDRLIPQAAERLAPGGYLLMEISPMIADRTRECVAADSRFEPAEIIKDLAGLARIVKAKRRA